MLLVRAGQTLLLIAVLTLNPAFASRIHRAPTSGHTKKASAKRSKKAHRVRRVRGQRSIDSDRATEIQSALIRQNYLSGAPSGQWDAQTEAAMKKYQADNGWQTKLMPDSRALIKLGLGPGHEADAVASVPRATGPSDTQPEIAEPAPNTLASVHSISQ